MTMKSILCVLGALACCCQASVRVQYDPEVAVLGQAASFCLDPSEGFPSLEGLKGIVLDEKGELLEAIRKGKRKVVQNVDLTEAFARAQAEFEATVPLNRIDQARECAQRLQSVMNTEAFKRRLQNVTTFFGGKEDLAFDIFVFPVLHAHRAFAFLMGKNSVLLSQMPEHVSLEEHLGMALHEICHSLLRQRGYNTWQEKAHDVPAMAYLEEALVTCLGNRLKGDPQTPDAEKEGAYDGEIVEEFSKLILPLVRRYLKEGWALDEAFVQEAEAIFIRAFPRIQDDYRALFFCNPRLVSALSEKMSEEEVCLLILSYFFTEEIDNQKYEDIVESRRSADIYLLSNSKEIKGVTISGLKDILCVRKVEGRLKILIQTDEIAKVHEALAWLQKQRFYESDFVLNLRAK